MYERDQMGAVIKKPALFSTLNHADDSCRQTSLLGMNGGIRL